MMRRDEHLNMNEVIKFLVEDLLPTEAKEVDDHLSDCVFCSKLLEEIYTAQEVFPSQRWAEEREEFIKNLKKKIFAQKEGKY